MTRIFRSTTALVATVSLLTPSLALAETPITDAAARQMQSRAAQTLPQLADTLAREVAGGLTPDALACMDGGARPCADDTALMTPKGVAVFVSESGNIVLAPAADQDAQAGDIAPAVAQVEGSKNDDTLRMAQAESPVVLPQLGRRAPADAAKEDAMDKKGKAEAKAERKANRKADGKGMEDKDKDGKDGKGKKKPAVVVPDEAPAPVKSDAPAVVPNPEASATRGVVAPVVPTAPAKKAAPAPKPAEPVVAPAPVVPKADGKQAVGTAKPVTPAATPKKNQADAAVKPGGNNPVVVAPTAKGSGTDAEALAKALGDAEKKEQGKAKGNKAATAAAAVAAAAGAGAVANGSNPAVVTPPSGALAATTGQKVAPTPVPASETDTGALADALAKAQAATEKQKPPVVAAPNNGNPRGVQPVVVPDPANGAGAVADALKAPATLGKGATSVVVTEDSARSSSEDFGTSVAAAAAAAAAAAGNPVNNMPGADRGKQPIVIPQPNGQQPGNNAGRSDDDDDNDTGKLLAGIALAGLGAYAVGQLIQNQGQVALNTGDRVVVQAPDGSQQILKDDNALLLQPGAQVTTENFPDGSSRSIVTREDGSRVVTIRDAQLRVLRRTLIAADGTPTELINDAAPSTPVQVSALPPAARPVVVGDTVSEADLRTALQQEAAVDRRFSLSQVRNISQVRNLVAPISIDTITFDTGSAAIRPQVAQQLSTLGSTMADMVRNNPSEIFLIEGYTDTVGQPASNLALSDRRAESLALALTEYFAVPPENLVVQGYGEQFLKVNSEGDIRENRRVGVRRITGLLQN